MFNWPKCKLFGTWSFGFRCVGGVQIRLGSETESPRHSSPPGANAGANPTSLQELLGVCALLTPTCFWPLKQGSNGGQQRQAWD